MRAEWQRVASMASEGQVVFNHLQVHTDGDEGFVVGTETGTVVINGQSFSVKAWVTNIFEKSSGEWKVVHHHVDTIQSIERAIGNK